ncbi:sensor histidine kinase [Flavobacterium sp. J49]|uniref:tetratricopeptide repeat-containing sensor histidine kinase n=1 Tax=Flavobacterium sp. J49 TaxID=2718534 RepID=UPI0015945D6D|nr:sensor histidine kinase [Flavobacterium sp. J49]MBF6640498.1 sensor histidine kinase [Flavobacterium sp. J49]NIC01745.1 tetratricopeptide repeat protein [Flavobacterium sp. J49]
MKKGLLFIVLGLITQAVNAQNAQDIIDKLKKELQANPDAKKTASIYSDLTWYYSKISIDSALYYGGKAVVESKKLNDSALVAQVYSDIGAVYFIKGDFVHSKLNYLTAYKIRKLRNDLKGVAKINNNLANIYEKTHQYKQAMASFLEALEYFEGIKDEKNTSIIKGNIGLIHLKLKNYPKALKYINEVVLYQEQNNFTEELCVSCLNLGNVYLHMQDTINALRFYDKSVKACTAVGNKKGISSGFNNIASIKSEQKKSKDALALYEKSKQVREELNSDLDKANFDLNLALELITNKKYIAAKKLLVSTKSFYEQTHHNEKLQKNYKSLITVYSYLNKPDSVDFYLDKLAVLDEQLLVSKAEKQTAELETKYQTEKKERLIQKSKAEIATRELEIKKKETQFLILGLISLALLVIIYLVYRQQKLKNKQQEQEFELKSAIAKIETQNKLQEQRLDISRDLHDNIGSQLTFIISSVDNIKYAFDIQNAKLDSKLSGISDFAKSTIIELRDTIWAMNKSEITFEDLQARIHNFIEKAQEAKEDIQFNFDVDATLKNIKFTSVEGMNLYRTIQEAINNSIKYANPKKISISITPKDSVISITIADDGIGFDMEQVEFGNGIHNMRKRIADNGGLFEIISAKETGTKISIQLKNQ